MPWAAAAAWRGGKDYDRTRGCENTHDGTKYPDWDGHCKGDFWEGEYKGKGRRTRFECAKACGPHVQYARGSGGHPCAGASEIKGIPINISGSDHVGLRGSFSNAPGAFWCRFNDDANTMKAASGRRENTIGGQGGKSVYDQLIFGNRVGGYAEDGYCSNANRMGHVVHNDGRTCFQMIKGKLGEAAAKVKAIQYCEKNRTDPKCKCINVAGSGFIDRCRQNPNWAGCKEVLAGIKDFENAGLKSATGLYGNADCIVPNICSGDVYEPNTRLSACANKMAICNQIMKLDNIEAFGDVKAAQGCNIDFAAEQAKRDKTKSMAQSAAEADKRRKEEADAAAAAAKKAAADKAATDKAATDKAAAAKLAADKAAAKAKAAGASPAEVQAAADKAAADVESKPVEDFVKPTGFGGFSTTQLAIGGGGAFLLCCCCLIILILATSGGGNGGGNGGGSGRFRR